MRRFPSSRAGARSAARAALVALFVLAGFGVPAFAADFVVTKTADSSDGTCDVDCSLREAIIAANANPGPDRVILGTSLTYTLSVGGADPAGVLTPGSGDLDILDALTIEGNGSTVSAGGIDRVFEIRGAFSITINSLTMTGGVATGSLSLGGGLFIGAGSTAVLNGSTVSGNSTAADGGARDSGGGIAAVGSYDGLTTVTTLASLTLTNSTVSGNTGLNGGGIVCVLCALTLSNSTIAGNTADGTDGGGIDVVGNSSTVSVVSSTLQGNAVAGGRGGALSVPFGTSLSTLSRSRIVSNTGTTGSAVFNGTATITAINNWWGCSFGPGAGGAGCSTTANGTAGTVTSTPYLVLGVAAAPAAIPVGATSSVTADLTFNSASADTSSGGTLPNGITATFAGTLGTFATPTATTSAGRASNVFTAGVTGSASISTTVDAQTVGTSILVGYGTTTTLQGAPSSPVFVPDAVLLTATVASVLPAGGTPSGTVIFRDGSTMLAGCGGVSLNASGVATCNIPGNTLSSGSKSFTAEFVGGVSHLGSTSPVLSYTYAACTASPVVANSNDSGAGSLRQAIADACPGSSVTFNMGTVVSPIGLTSGTLSLARNVTIAGPGANVLTVQRTSGTFGVLTIQPGLTVTMSGVTIAGGTATGSNRGGGIYNNGSNLTLLAVAVTGNTAMFGGAIFNSAEVGSASLTVVNSTLSGNSASAGGGIVNQGVGAIALLTIRNTTISGNTALGNGGALFNGGTSSPITITNGTITNNRADSVGTGGGMYLGPGSGVVVLENTIVAGNIVGLSPATTPDDVAGALDAASTHTLVGTSAGMTGITHGVSGNLVGAPASPIDPRLGVLLSQGGPTFTHALLAGSPALDAGDNTLAAAAGLTTDQRGRTRTADGPDADTIATVDLGAFEAGASLAALPDRTVTEDSTATLTFELSDPSLVTAVTATSANTVLVPNSPASLSVSGSSATRTLTITPQANAFGTADITVTVTTGSDTMSDTLLLTVTPVADTPAVTNASTSEDTLTPSGLVLSRNPVDGADVTHFKITGIAGGTLFLADAVTPVANGVFVTAAQGAAGFRFMPAANSFATGQITAQASTAGSDAGLGGNQVTASIAVAPVADTPTISGAVTSVNTQTSSGLVVTRNAADGPEVTHFKVTGITRGTLFQHDGTTPIALGAFITVAEGNAGLRFTPEANSLLSGLVTVRASIGASDAGLGGASATANIVVSPRILTTGAEGPGVPMVRRFAGSTGRPTAGPTAEFLAFAAGFSGGVRVADADVTGDGVADVIAGTGPGVEARILVFDGATRSVVRDLLPGFTANGGVYVAAGDVDGDGWPDIIAGDGGSSALVRVTSGVSGAPLWSMSIADPAFSGGVRVAAGDVDGDGFADLIVGSGPGGGSTVRIFSGATRAELRAFAPFAGFVGGVFVAAGDVNGDGYADVIAGADVGGGPHVRVFDGATGVERFGFFAADGTFSGGVRVAAGDVTGDGNADVITALGPGANLVAAFDGITGARVTPLETTIPPGDGLFISTAAPANRMVIDAPTAGATLPPDFRLHGWAFEEDAPGTGVAAIHVWAYPVGGGAAAFLGVATLGDPRPDVGAIFGASYAASGYHLDVTGLAGGTYDIVAFANSSESGHFNMRRVVRVRIVSPGAEVQLQIDTPSAGPVRPTFRLAGWAFDVGGVGASSGIEAVHVWAFPVAGGSPAFVGAATLGGARPDVAALFGPRAANAGYHLDVSGLAAGDYVLRAFAKAFALPSFTVVQAVSITVTPWAPAIHMSVDVPAAGALSSGTFMVAGWVLALDAPSAPGIDAVHVWGYPVGSGVPTFLGAATLGGARPDVGALFGPGYTSSGFGLSVTGLPSGTWDLAVFPLAAGAPGFGAARVVRVTIP